MSEASTADVKAIPAAALGGPGRPDPARCSQAAIEALSHAAGPEMRLTQMQLDVSSRLLGQAEVSVRARIDKATRSIVFASVDASEGDDMIFRAQALFSREES
jgi:hypothetical protein